MVTRVAPMNSGETHPASSSVLDEPFHLALIDNLYYAQGAAVASASVYDYYMALSETVRRQLLERWRATTEAHYAADPKFVYYLSAEYLLGKQLPQNLLYTNLTEPAKAALAEHKLTLENCIEQDPEPGLGNGGLGRLAACFLDSLATLDIPAVGYGIRYEYGIFRQSFEHGWQVESPDEWALRDYPWEISHSNNMVEVKLYGHTEHYLDEQQRHQVRWIAGQTVRGEPYHLLVPGYETGTVNMLRLWRARASRRFDFQVFDTGDYSRAVEEKALSESISKVLYPNDSTPQGRELRLKQQYFFVACSLHDIIRRFHLRNQDWAQFPDKVVMQLNDTHPVIAIPELMRLLLDEYKLGWDAAWQITSQCFAYTCHTLMPEALEKWPVDLFVRMLPRHLEIIYGINQHLLEEVRAQFPYDEERVRRMSIIDESNGRQVRMANLAATGCFAINGVAALHSQLLKDHTLRDFAELWPQKFHNKTNGVTPRRFMKLANPGLSDLITRKLGNGWLNNLERLRELEPFSNDAEFCAAWRKVKEQNKQALAEYARQKQQMTINPASFFDIMVKRLHEYKRQLLKTLHIITLYHRLKDNPNLDLLPRTFVFGAKAAPGYVMAKRIIKLINAVADVVNHDRTVAGRLQVAFLENFNVSSAQIIYPAADLSEQISLAGKEASGTGNMKFALNGAVTIGTLDGANVEIRDLVGPENFFLFGLTVEEVFALKERGYRPFEYYQRNPELKRVIDSISGGLFSQGDTELFRPIVDSLLYYDEYMLLADYQSYLDCQAQVEQAYRNPVQWTRMSILNTARSGFFSSDRTIREYCQETWHVKPVPVKMA
ncbi:MAG: glycogen/starch/alpha-glucan phosphorylase [Caldilineaceae bacterium]